MFYKRIFFIVSFILFSQFSFSQNDFSSPKEFDARLLTNFVKAVKVSYPENFVNFGFDINEQLWFIDLKNDDVKKTQEKEKRFFYKNARILPKENLSDWKNFNPISTEFYPQEMPNPNEFSDFKRAFLKDMSSSENRDEYKPSCFTLVQNFLYQAYTPKQVEPQIITIEFLDWKVRIHKKIEKPLLNIDKKIRNLALTNKEINNFLKMPTVITGYNWREVRDNENRSSHSWGISVDIVPKRYGSKQIYWKWTQDFYNDGWITYPIKKRWMPPEEVISIFESEGFIWGGKWDIWDNMHFEYHPEILKLSNPS
jgi:hypothetical protein